MLSAEKKEVNHNVNQALLDYYRLPADLFDGSSDDN